MKAKLDDIERGYRSRLADLVHTSSQERERYTLELSWLMKLREELGK